jgi:hypothetical protein
LVQCRKKQSDTTVIQTITGSRSAARMLLILKKAAVGIEPTNKGFAVWQKLFR